jgi:predicted transcriptional regulator
MKVQLSIEQEAELSEIAAQTGRTPEELANEALDRYLKEEGRFLSAVRTGQDAAGRGEFIAPSQVWAGVQRALISRA